MPAPRQPLCQVPPPAKADAAKDMTSAAIEAAAAVRTNARITLLLVFRTSGQSRSIANPAVARLFEGRTSRVATI
jgi:hypothetical protein